MFYFGFFCVNKVSIFILLKALKIKCSLIIVLVYFILIILKNSKYNSSYLFQFENSCEKKAFINVQVSR